MTQPCQTDSRLTPSKPIDTSRGLVGGDLASGSSSVSGGFEQRLSDSVEDDYYLERRGCKSGNACVDRFHTSKLSICVGLSDRALNDREPSKIISYRGIGFTV